MTKNAGSVRRTSMRGLLVGCALLAGTALLFGAGCTADQQWRASNWYKYPKDYDSPPMGPRYDTPAKVNQLNDEKLKQYMTMWLDYRRAWLKEWRGKAPPNENADRIRRRMDTFKAVIQDRVNQLAGDGQSL